MKTLKQQGVGGEWIEVKITIGQYVYSRTTSPDGKHKYANVSGRNNVSVRAGGKTAKIIDCAIADALSQQRTDMMCEFENKLTLMGINGGCMAYSKTAKATYYANEHIQWMWLQFVKMKTA